jgi:hypothetical protein
LPAFCRACIKTTYDIAGMRDMATVKANELMNGYYKELAIRQGERLKKIQEKRAKGEKLTRKDNFSLRPLLLF